MAGAQCEHTTSSTASRAGLYTLTHAVCGFIHIIWDFSVSDLITFVVPNTVFGVLAALAANPLVNSDPSPSVSAVLQNLMAVIIFNWWHTFIFNLSNQWSPESVAEDRINKPGRPIPNGRITSDQTRRTILAIIPLSLCLNYYLNVWVQGISIHLITWLYNELGGSDEAFYIRDFYIAAAFAMHNSGSLKIAAGCYPVGAYKDSCDLNRSGFIWTGIISAVIFTTMQVQDLKDQEGDRLRERKTVVLLLGEHVSRSSIAFFIIFWSLVCGYFWGSRPWNVALPLLPALLVARKVMKMGCSQVEDRKTWQLWCLWLMFLYALPLCAGAR